MKKRLISLIVAVVMLFSMLCPAAYADDETVSFDTCTHEWETPLRSGYSITIPGSDVSFSVKTEQCKKCKWYKHVATIFIAEFTYYSPLNVDANGLVPTELATYWANVWYNNFGKNATATKFTPGGGSTSGGGVGRPKGYADDSGTPSINSQGQLIVVPEFNYYRIYSYNSSTRFAVGNYTGSVSNKKYYDVVTDITSEHCNILAYTSSSYTKTCLEISYKVVAPVNGYYTVPKQSIGYNDVQDNYLNKMYSVQRTISSDRKYYSKGQTITLSISGDAGGNFNRGYSEVLAYFIYPKIICEPIETTVNQYNKLSINNNTWNGNIYVDNSNNLTYIYPQYTTVNEKNETVTNISTTSIIYNNKTKQYYTYDQTTKNYYYITYNTQPTPSPSPTPAPTEKPDGSISTPETGKPGGDTGDTTGILAVLVEIRDNMIQGFLDIKAAFVAGFADISANFQLAIDNLNINIQNFFNKKMEDLPEPTPTPSPTPEPSNPTPSPSPSPAPTDPPSPSPAPDPGKPDSGDKTNNFWTIIFPNGGGTEDGKKGIFWALISLILALIAFFANLAVGVGYLFPFLPDGVVMTINTCLIVIFLFTIIKFIMRSK